MITLQEIKEFAEKEKACDTQLIPFLKFLNEGDELSCWQIVYGNLRWLRINGLDLPYITVEKLAHNICKTYSPGGYLSYIVRRKNGILHGEHIV